MTGVLTIRTSPGPTSTPAWITPTRSTTSTLMRTTMNNWNPFMTIWIAPRQLLLLQLVLPMQMSMLRRTGVRKFLKSADGRSALFVRDFGKGFKIFTFVIWAK